jgi:putative ABC transport system permease protein
MLHDLRYGIRVLLRAPGFTATAVTALALGIGATTAIFSVVHSVLLRPLPFREPRQLVALWERNRQDRAFVSPANFQDWKEQARSFTGMAAVLDTELNLTGGDGEPEELQA